MKHASLLTLILLLVLTAPAFAQEETTCPQLVQTAYETTQAACEEAGRDEACYGNNLVTADPQPEVEDFTFETPGDVADVNEIAALRLSSMDTSAAEWGISLIRIQADLPAESEDYVELLLFGNVEIENAGGEALEPTAEPNTESAESYSAMQAFYFVSGAADRPCAEAPDSGILIQTPEGVGEITVLVNEVVIDLGSTAYIQAQPSSDMVISTVEGQATITSQGTTVESPAGTFVTVPLDANGAANGVPSDPQPYDPANLTTLPIELLSREIAIAPALSEESSSTGGNLPPAGSWSIAYTSCTGTMGIIPPTLTQTLVIEGEGFMLGESTLFTETEPGVFSNQVTEEGVVIDTFITLLSDSLMEGTTSVIDTTGAMEPMNCTLELNFVGE